MVGWKNFPLWRLLHAVTIVSTLISITTITSATDLDKDTLQWCERVKSSPEPGIIFYNRIPKCGSSTMQELYNGISRKTRDVSLYELSSHYWFRPPSLDDRKRLYHVINKQITKPSTKLVVSGHVFYFPYDYSNIKYGKTLEHTQVIRKCESREMSDFLYTLYDSALAKNAKLKKRHTQFLRSMLNLPPNANIENCLSNESCLMNTLRPSMKPDYIVNYTSYCGTSCDRNNQIHAVRVNLFEKGHYLTFGLTEHMFEYLEMLECVYPNILGEITKRYQDRHNRQHAYTMHSPRALETVSKVVKRQCEDSADSMLYSEVFEPTFWKRYAALKSYPSTCCRSRFNTTSKKWYDNIIPDLFSWITDR